MGENPATSKLDSDIDVKDTRACVQASLHRSNVDRDRAKRHQICHQFDGEPRGIRGNCHQICDQIEGNPGE